MLELNENQILADEREQVEDAKELKTLLQVKGLKKHFPVKGMQGILKGDRPKVKAVDDVSFELYEGETFGLVGESGCGKSTTGRTIMRLTDPTEGEAIYRGRDIFTQKGSELRKIREEIQMVFQDPYSSLNPKKRIGHALQEPLVVHSIGDRKEHAERVMDIMQKVGLQLDHYYRFPHEFSGGQRQRIGLARALIANPKLIICDEPVSALDVSIQSQIINLLKQMQQEFNLTYLFIAHDISVVRHISDRIGVMYLGKLVETAPTDRLIGNALHPYTQALLSAVPMPNPRLKRERIELKGEIPSPLTPPQGCVFHTRCPFATEKCRTVVPQSREIEKNHSVACHLYD